jgi:hypothetical protein
MVLNCSFRAPDMAELHRTCARGVDVTRTVRLLVGGSIEVSGRWPSRRVPTGRGERGGLRSRRRAGSG